MLVAADSIIFSLLFLPYFNSKVVIPLPAMSLTTIVGKGVMIISVAESVYIGTTGRATIECINVPNCF